MGRARPSRLLASDRRASHGWFETLLARAESEAAGDRSAPATSHEWRLSPVRNERRRPARLVGAFVAGLALPVFLLVGVSLVAWQRSWYETGPSPRVARGPVVTVDQRPGGLQHMEPVEAVMRGRARTVLATSRASTAVATLETSEARTELESPSLPPRASQGPRPRDVAQPTLTPMRKTFVQDAPRAAQEVTLAPPRWRGRDREPVDSSDIVDWFIREYPRRVEVGGL
jgi:hypothetical protein